MIPRSRPVLDQALAARTDSCILWPMACDAAGYGQVTIDGIKRPAHAVICERAHGPRPTPAHQAAHQPSICHNPQCINPRHIRWATPAEQRADMAIDGTLPRREHHGRAKLTLAAVEEIRATAGTTQRALAQQYGVSQATIWRVLTNYSWTPADTDHRDD